MSKTSLAEAPAEAKPAGQDHFLELAETEQIAKIKKSLIYAKMARGEFPQPVRLSPRCVRWPASRVYAWVQDRIAESDAQAALPKRLRGGRSAS